MCIHISIIPLNIPNGINRPSLFKKPKIINTIPKPAKKQAKGTGDMLKIDRKSSEIFINFSLVKNKSLFLVKRSIFFNK